MERRLIKLAPQPHYTAKKLMAAISAFLVLGASSAFAGVKLSKNNKNKGEQPSVSDETPVLEAESSSDIEITDDLNLDFDIKDSVAVRQRAEQIYKLCSEDRAKEFSVNDIINLIYLVNGEYEMIDFGSAVSDTDKYKALQNLILKIERLLGNNVPGYVNVLAGNQKKADGDFIYSAYLLAKTTEGKKLAIEFENIVKEQKENIENGSKDKYEKTAEKYVDVVDRILKAAKENKLTAGEATIITKDEKAKNPLVTTFLSKISKWKKVVKELDKNLVNYTNMLGNKAVEALGLPTAVEDLQREFTTTPLGNSYNSSDAAKANAMAGGFDGGAAEKREVDAGGADLGTMSEKSGGGSIGTSTSEKVVGKEESHTEVEQKGGEVVSETEYTYVVDLPTNVNEIVTEILEEGGQEVEEECTTMYVDSEAQSKGKSLIKLD